MYFIIRFLAAHNLPLNKISLLDVHVSDVRVFLFSMAIVSKWKFTCCKLGPLQLGRAQLWFYTKESLSFCASDQIAEISYTYWSKAPQSHGRMASGYFYRMLFSITYWLISISPRFLSFLTHFMAFTHHHFWSHYSFCFMSPKTKDSLGIKAVSREIITVL